MFNFLKSNKNKAVVSENVQEYEFKDISLFVQSVSFEGQSIVLLVQSKDLLNQVEFKIVIDDKSSKVIFSEGAPTGITSTQKGITLERTGEKSDNFLKFLSDKEIISSMVDKLSFTSVALEGDPAKLLDQPVKFKLFYDKNFEDQNSAEAVHFYEDVYFEFYLNIDLINKRVEFNEKDINYREKMITMFTNERS